MVNIIDFLDIIVMLDEFPSLPVYLTPLVSPRSTVGRVSFHGTAGD